MINKRFGKLIVLRENGRSKDRCILWECRCDCGKILNIKSKGLSHGVKSCGCLRRIAVGEANFKRVYRGYQNEAKRKKLPFDISTEDFRKITSRNCFYCKTEPKQKSYRKFSNGAYIFNGIDRKDNNKGYIWGNILPCCFICNRAKSDTPYKEFILWIQAIKTR